MTSEKEREWRFTAEQIEDEIDGLEKALGHISEVQELLSASLLDARERLMGVRTQIPGICPWCGEEDCRAQSMKECPGVPDDWKR
jgi:hypothetical protein